VPRHLKTDLLDKVLLGNDVGSAIVFARTKHGADRLARQLKRRGHSEAALHGDRSQSQRERALSDLKRGRVQVLVATDIASRGIDVEDISHVINFDVPHTPEDYVHRIGRTGRVDAVGDAFTLMSPEEKDDVAAIERFLGRSIPRVLIPDFDYKRHSDGSAKSGGHGGGRGDHAPRERGGRPRGGEGRGRSAITGRREWGAGSTTGGNGAASRPGAGAGQGAHGPAPGAHRGETETEHGRRPKRNAPDRRGRKRM
jgi:ATP-dependent RNA helicase RhlE